MSTNDDPVRRPSAAGARARADRPDRPPVAALPEPPPLTAHGPARVIAHVQPEGRRRQDHDDHQPRARRSPSTAAGCCSSTSTRRARCRSGSGVNPHELDLTVYNLLMERDGHRRRRPAQDQRPRHGPAAEQHRPVRRRGPAGQRGGPGADAGAGARAGAATTTTSSSSTASPRSGLLTVNALTAAHGVIIPLECEFFALRGVALLIDTIDKVQERLNPRLELEGILATMYDARTLHGREVLARVVEAFGDKVFHTVISRTVRFPETTVAGEPITTLRLELGRRAGLPRPRQGGARPMSRRADACPAPTSCSGPPDPATTSRHVADEPVTARVRVVPDLPRDAPCARRPEPRRRCAERPRTGVRQTTPAARPQRRPPADGRERHDEKITVYVSAEELHRPRARPAGAARRARAGRGPRPDRPRGASRWCSPTSRPRATRASSSAGCGG